MRCNAPETDGRVVASGDEQLAVRTEGNAVHGPCVPPQRRTDLPARPKIPQADGAVVETGPEEVAAGRDGDTPYPAMRRQYAAELLPNDVQCRDLCLLGGRDPIRLQREQAREMQVAARVCARLRRQLSRLGFAACADRRAALRPRHAGENQGDEKRRDCRTDDLALRSRRGPPTLDDVCNLLAGRSRSVALLLSEPGLGVAQIPSAENKAAIALRVGPLTRPRGETRVLIAPGEIDLQRIDELRHTVREVVDLTQENPFRVPQRLRKLALVDRSIHHRDDQLVQRGGVVELVATVLGGDRVRADNEDECLACLDASLHALSPVRTCSDVGDVDPDLLAEST